MQPVDDSQWEELLLCEDLLSKGLIRSQDLRNCLARQRDLLEEEGRLVSLVSLLSDARACSPERIRESRDELSAAIEAHASEPVPTKRFGPYDIIEPLGEGGMGIVFRAVRRADNQTVALKVMRTDRTVSETMLERFRQEATAIQRLDHPAIVRILDVGEVEETPYLAMELIEGSPLADLKERISPEGALRIVAQLAAGVHHAHEAGIVHRDLKPQNVLIRPNGEPVLTDFGLVRDLTRVDRLTRTGSAVGTPAYMAPEQISGDRSDIGPPTDVYALGILLYELFTGTIPFRGPSPMELYQQICFEPLPTPPEDLPLPRGAVSLVRKACSKLPAHRHGSAAEFKEAIERILAGRGAERRSRIGLVASLLLFITLGTAGAYVLKDRLAEPPENGSPTSLTAGLATRWNGIAPGLFRFLWLPDAVESLPEKLQTDLTHLATGDGEPAFLARLGLAAVDGKPERVLRLIRDRETTGSNRFQKQFEAWAAWQLERPDWEARLDALIAEQPRPHLLLVRGRRHLSENRQEEAWQDLERALELNEEDPALHLALARLFCRRKRFTWALTHLDRAAEHAAAPRLKRKLALYRAVALTGTSRNEEAVDVLLRVIQDLPDPLLPTAYRTLGLLRLRAARWPDALACFDAHLELEPKNVAARLGRALALIGLEKPGEAIRVAETVRATRPEAFLPAYVLAVAHQAADKPPPSEVVGLLFGWMGGTPDKEGRDLEALHPWTDATRETTRPLFRAFWDRLTELEIPTVEFIRHCQRANRAGHPERTIQLYETKAGPLLANNPEFLRTVALALVLVPVPKKALAVASKLVRLEETDENLCFRDMVLLRCFHPTEDLRQKIEARMLAVKERNPSLAMAWTNLGFLDLKQNDRDSDGFLQRAVDLDPDFAFAVGALGLHHLKQAQEKKAPEQTRNAFRKALFHLRRANRLDPTVVAPWLNRAHACNLTGRFNEALFVARVARKRLEGRPLGPVAIFHEGRALFGLERFAEAHLVFLELWKAENSVRSLDGIVRSLLALNRPADALPYARKLVEASDAHRDLLEQVQKALEE